MAIGRKEARAPDRDGPKRHGALSGRQQRAEPGPKGVGLSEGVSLSKSDSADKQPSRQDWPQGSQGAGDIVNLLGPLNGRGERSLPGRADATFQSGRSISPRRTLGPGKALRTDTPHRGSATSRRREGVSPKGRDARLEAEARDSRVAKEEIGNRQRASGGVKQEVRESVKEPLQEPSSGSGLKREQPKEEREESPEDHVSEGRARSPRRKGQVRRPTPEYGQKRRREKERRPKVVLSEPARRVVYEDQGRRSPKAASRRPHQEVSGREEPRERKEQGSKREHGKRQEPGPERKRRRQEGFSALVEKEPKEGEKELVEESRPPIERSYWKAQEDDFGGSFRRWLEDEPPSNLSAAQLASHLLLQGVRNKGPLADYIRWSLQSPEKREVRERNLFPLPLWPDSRMQLQKIMEEGEALEKPGKWRERGSTRSAAQKALRVEGLKAWHGLAVISLNYLYGDRPKPHGPPAGGEASAAQERALERLWDMVRVFADDKEKKGVPRTPLEEWKHTIGDLSVSYTGEIVEKAAKLTLKQIIPGLPSPDHGGLVDLLELLPPELQESLQDPDSLVKTEFHEKMPKPRVMCDESEWAEVVKAMFERGLVKPVKFIPSVEGVPVVNGAFGVPKAGKTLETGEEVLRLIMDLRATNWFMTQLEADTATLTGAASFQRIIIEDGAELLVSGEDLTAAFYLFRLPEVWTNYMVLGCPVPGTAVGLESPELVHVGLCVLPMGWRSSVGLMQAAHRRLVLGSPLRGGAGLASLAEINRLSVFPDLDEGPAWSIYLDDTTIIEKVSAQVSKELQGKPAEEQEKLRQAYAWWGIPTNEAKALEREKKAERLGAVLDGEKGLLRTSTLRSLQVMSLGAWIRGQKTVQRKALQIYAGKLVHILQFRRCMFAYLEEVFCAIAQGPPLVPVTEKLRSEMILLEMGLPLAMTNLRAVIDPIVTASDACESGGGICVASRLTRAGKDEVLAMLEGEEPGKPKVDDPTELDRAEKVVVIDLFSGIGGLTQSLKKAGVHWDLVVFVEKDKNCRRLLRRVYPGAIILSDIKKFDENELRRILKKQPEVTGFVVGGGSPCQGLSKLKSQRKHLLDERSGLFYEAARVFAMVEKEALQRKAWLLKFLENVIADAADIKEMSFELRIEPVMVDSQYLSRARRPRLFWVSVEPSTVDEVEEIQREHFKQLIYRAEPEPMEAFLEKDHDWAGGARDPNLKFPTFTRSIKRSKPPPSPVGLEKAEPAARVRWEEDCFRYPPYTYHDDYMVLTPEVTLRPLNAGEREILMGYPQGHTEKLLKKPPETKEEKEEAEDLRCSAIGNAFHTNAVASLLDHIFASMGLKERKGASAIRDASLAMQSMAPEKIAVEDLEEEDESFEEENEDTISVPGNIFMEKVERQNRSRGLKSEFQSDEKLSQLLVAAYVKRQEFRGSDVRLDVGSLYRPDSFPRASVSPTRWVWHVAHHWPFREQEHINVLELRSMIHTFEWRLRKSSFGGCRALHLCDSQVALSVAVKGRSSSRQLNRQLKRFAALQLAGGLYPLLAWVESAQNPADAPSRHYE